MRLQLDDRELQAALRYLPEKMVRPAARMALNDSGRQGNTAARQEIRKKWNLKAGFIGERVKVGAFASEEDLTVVIEAWGRPIDLTYFGARWVKGNQVVTRQGTRMLKRAKKGGGVFYEAMRGVPGRLPNAFIAKVRAGKSGVHIGVFVREGKKRLPVIKKGVVSVPSMFEQEPVFEAVRRTVEAKFPERFAHHIDRTAERFG